MPEETFEFVKAMIDGLVGFPVRPVMGRSRPLSPPIRYTDPDTMRTTFIEDPVKVFDPVVMRFRRDDNADFIRLAEEILSNKRSDDVTLVTPDGTYFSAGVEAIRYGDPVEIKLTPRRS